MPWWADQFGVPTAGWDDPAAFDRAYLDAALRQGAADTGVFGMRLMWESLANLSQRLAVFHPDLACDRARFDAAFGAPLYLYLRREDKVAQAISLFKAERSGLWHRHADGSERERLEDGAPPAYDPSALAERVKTAEAQDAGWAAWFARYEIEPLCLTYESLAEDPRTALAKILVALDLDPTFADRVEPRTARLADAESQAWANKLRGAIRE